MGSIDERNNPGFLRGAFFVLYAVLVPVLSYVVAHTRVSEQTFQNDWLGTRVFQYTIALNEDLMPLRALAWFHQTSCI